MQSKKRLLRTLAVSLTMFAATQASAATFTDSFASGLNATYWNVTQTTPGLYDVTTPGGQIHLARSNHAPTGGFQAVNVNLNLAALGGNIAGAFSTQIDFNSAVIAGSLLNQVQLNLVFANGARFLDVLDNASGGNFHVWDDIAARGGSTTPLRAGTFKVERVGTTVSGYFNNAFIFSNANNSALTHIDFSLQNNRTNDPISVNFDNFSLTAASVPAPIPEPETYAMLLAGLGLLGFIAQRKQGRL